MNYEFKCYEHLDDKGNYTKKKICGITGNEYKVELTNKQFMDWRGKRMLIQNIVPDMSLDDRDFLITGLTPEETEKLYTNNQE